MSEQTNTYVEVLFPGSFYPEESVYKVAARDPEDIAKKYPKCFAFRFYDLTSKTVTVDGEQQKVSGKEKNKTGRYYPDAQLYTTQGLKELPGDYEILISNMECNGWKHVVKTRRGNFQPFEKNDVIL